MVIPELKDLEVKCQILEKIAGSYPPGSPERVAIDSAAHAMHYISHADIQAKFREWMENLSKPPTAWQVLQAKLAGVDEISHELPDDTIRELEQFVKRLKQR